MSLHVRPLSSDEDAKAFRRLNEEWITRSFELEEEDARQLADPRAAYVDPGGEILIAEEDGETVGCVALVPVGGGDWELSKMAVTPASRGRGLGRRLLAATIERARELGVGSLILVSSSKLPAALHLYEDAGFEHVDPASLHAPPYARADVYMRMDLS